MKRTLNVMVQEIISPGPPSRLFSEQRNALRENEKVQVDSRSAAGIKLDIRG